MKEEDVDAILSGEKVDKKTLLEMMRDPDVHVRVLIYNFLLEESCVSRVFPSLMVDDVYIFFKEFCFYCITHGHDEDDPEDNFNPSIAGMEFCNLFRSWFKSKKDHPLVLEDLRDSLGNLYLAGSGDTRITVVDTILEHLFENAQVRKFFVGWKKDPILSEAYLLACDWSPDLPV